MNDNERQKRRNKKLQKQKQKREDRSRPAKSPRDVARDPTLGRDWPLGDCWVSQSWDEPGAKVAVVVSRTDGAGNTVVAEFVLDRSGPGLVEAKARGGLPAQAPTAIAGELGERTGTALVETTAALATALVRDAVAHGTAAAPDGAKDALLLLHDVEAATLDVPFGPKPEKPERGGLFGAISRWFGG